jgi:predicted ATPase
MEPSERNYRPDRLIHEITLKNLLSFGPDTPALKLGNLNVLIGPNGSGKSNLIEAIGLLKAATRVLGEPVKEAGGVHDWLWKGAKHPTASIDVVLHNANGRDLEVGGIPLRHRIEFTEHATRFEVVDEAIENAWMYDKSENDTFFYYRYRRGNPLLIDISGDEREMRRESLSPDESVLSQVIDPWGSFPELDYLRERYYSFSLYREWTFGRYTEPRLSHKPDLPTEYLLPSGENLAHVLNYLRPKVKQKLIEALQEIYAGVEDFNVQFSGGVVQLYLEENGFSIPATRLSDGTLRYLCLLAILLHPDPPPLICIDEPELGLHPDIIPTVAKLLQEASKRSQVIVTTHSTTLVDAMTETPECVLVCEKHEGATWIYRHDADELKHWLKNYSLGKLWRIGELGGNRW